MKKKEKSHINWGAGLPDDYKIPENTQEFSKMKVGSMNWTLPSEFAQSKIAEIMAIETEIRNTYPDGFIRHFRCNSTFYSAISDKEGKFIKLLSYAFPDNNPLERKKFATKDAWMGNITFSLECDAEAVYHLPQLLHSIIEEGKA